MITNKGENLAYILGLPRSGTTLLAVLLEQHAEIACPPEPWIMLALESFGKTCSLHPADSHVLGQAVSEFWANDLQLRASRAFAVTLYNEKLKERQRRVFVDKTPRYYLILSYLEALFPQAKWIWLQRNPLDIAASYKRTWGIDIPALLKRSDEHLATIDYIIGQDRILNFFETHSDSIHIVKYENLVAEPHRIVNEVIGYLQLSLIQELPPFDFTTSPFATSNLGDRNILATTTPHSNSVGAWQHAFTVDELQILVDALGAQTFRRLGYEANLSALFDKGVVDRGDEVSAGWRRRATRQLAAREDYVHFVSSLDIGLSREAKQGGSEVEQTPEVRALREQLNSMGRELTMTHLKLASKEKESGSLAGKLRRRDEEIRAWRFTSRDILHRHYAQAEMSPSQRLFSAARSGLRNVRSTARLILRRRNRSPLPRISIVTPVHNGEAHIRETIESVLAQGYPNLEYIIVDGGSSDRTLEIVEEYRGRIHVVISENDAGMYDAIGKGFLYSTGSILGYLNSDDLYEPGGLQRVGEYFRNHPAAKVIYHEDTVMMDGWRFPNIAQPYVDVSRLLDKHILFQDGVFFRREAYFAVGGIDSEKRLAGDFDLWLRLARKYRFRRVEGHVSCFRIRKGQLSEDLAAYHAEIEQSLNSFSQRTGSKVIRWPRHWANRLRSFYRLSVRPRKLFFPMDFNGIPFPPGIAPQSPPTKVTCPLTGEFPDRLLFSTRDTRFGDNRINYIYYNSESDVALTYPPLSKDELNSLYQNYYSNPPTEVCLPLSGYRSPYAGYCGDRFSKLAGRPYSRISLASLFLGRIDWNDHTFGEIKENLGSLVSAKSEKVRFLDVGCFEGNLLDEIRKETDWEAYGLDSNPRALEVARSKGHQVWESNAEDAYSAIPEDFRFHLIFLGQTIEHLNNPLAVLRRLKHMLEPGGLLALTTPNLDSQQVKLFGPTWSHWHPPYHRYIFSMRSMRLLSRLLGMKLLCLKSHSHPYWTCLSVQLNQLGIGAAVSHAVNFPEGIVRQARNIVGWSKLLWDWRGRGDYLFAVMKNND